MPSKVKDAGWQYKNSFAIGIRPEKDISILEWADEYRYLPRKSSAEPGKYRSSRTPYLREIMDVMSSNSPIKEVVCMKGTQLGFTELGNNWFGYVVDVAPGPMMMVFPTGALAADHSKQKLQPTIKETPRISKKIKAHKSREGGNTIDTKEFPGGILFISGSNSGAFFRSKSIRFLFLDDVDGYAQDVGGEGDPADLAKRRTDSYGNRKKILEVSTPTNKGVSRIEKSYLESSQATYYVPCPYCGTYQELIWGGEEYIEGIKFKRDADGRAIHAWYECNECSGRIEEHHKTEMLEKGRWVHKHPERNKKGYQLSGLYSPLGWVSWLQIVTEFLDARNSRERLKVWRNTRLGETFEEAGDQPDWIFLRARSEPYGIMTVPYESCILTAGVDTQDNRLSVVIRAWGEGEESWLVYWGEIYGDPGREDVWKNLDALLFRQFAGRNGQHHVISAGIDTGGHHSQDVHNYCRRRFPRVIAIKGASMKGKPIAGKPSDVDFTWNGVTIKNGAKLWLIGTDTAKAVIYSRLKIEAPGPGYYHTYIGTPDDYFIQLSAEKLITKYIKGYAVQEWVKTGPRNEALDCEVYCYAAALRAGLGIIDFSSKPKHEPEEKKPARTQKPKGGRW